MALNEDITQQYAQREHKAGLYNSLYSQLADLEKISNGKKLVSLFLNDPQNKTVLEIGAGQGGNVPLLNECGFRNSNIFLNELLPERIQAIKSNWPNVGLYAGNALEIDFSEKYDCVFQSTVFTSILKDDDRKKLADKMWGLLKPGGIILWYDFIYNNPNNTFVKKVNVKELKQLFPSAAKNEIVKITLAPPIGRRVGKLYSLFNLPFLRSHVLAVFKKD